MNITYELATNDDFADVVKFLTKFCSERNALPEEIDTLLERFTSGTHIVICARHGKMIGMVATFIDGNVMIGDAIYVLPKYRQSGVAKTLVEKMVEQGRMRGCSEVILLADLDKEEFWKNEKFEPERVFMRRMI